MSYSLVGHCIRWALLDDEIVAFIAAVNLNRVRINLARRFWRYLLSHGRDSSFFVGFV